MCCAPDGRDKAHTAPAKDHQFSKSPQSPVFPSKRHNDKDSDDTLLIRAESFAGQAHTTIPAQVRHELAPDIFQRFCKHAFQLSMKSHVESLLDAARAPSNNSSKSCMNKNSSSSTAAVDDSPANQAVLVVDRVREFLEGAEENMPACLPPTWPLMCWVFQPCQDIVQEIACTAATDMDREWSFQTYTRLQESVRSFLSSAADAGVDEKDIQQVEGTMQVLKSSCCCKPDSLCLYTVAGIVCFAQTIYFWILECDRCDTCGQGEET
jgi:hypothetical protein